MGFGLTNCVTPKLESEKHEAPAPPRAFGVEDGGGFWVGTSR